MNIGNTFFPAALFYFNAKCEICKHSRENFFSFSKRYMEKVQYSDNYGVFYHIFIPFFCDSNGDGIGDLKGITQKLDYLNDGKGGGLGVRGIWLSPLHPSPSYHKYDVLDYYSVAPEYGTMEDLEELVREADKRGMSVLLDLVLNCTSDRHPDFLYACEHPESRQAKMYWLDANGDARFLDRDAVWNTLPSWHKTVNGISYLGIYSSVMPDLDFNSRETREECKKIATFWLNKGIGGFRLDSAMHLYSTSEVEEGVSHHAKNIEWWEEFRSHCRSVRPDCYLVGEVWDKPDVRALYYRGLDSSFHFFLGNEIADFVHGKLPAPLFSKKLENAYLCAGLTDAKYTDSPFLGNHDMPRFAEELCPDEQDLKLAAAICMTLEGTPFVYYGEELGMRADKADVCPAYLPADALGRARTAFDWGEEAGMCATRFSRGYLSEDLSRQREDTDSVYSLYRRLIGLRNANKALSLGRWEPYPCPNDRVFAYRMRFGAESLVVLHNASPSPVPFPAEADGKDYLDLMDGTQTIHTVKNKRTLPPRHSAIVYC